MKSKVQLSRFALVLTLIITVVLIVGCISLFNERPGFWFLLGILIMLLSFGFLYGPTQIITDHDNVTIKSYLLKHKILICNIESVELFQPTMGTIRIFASGGYFGYWGIFYEGDIGRYTGYYGKSSDCFLIRMKNGDKYVLGCQNPEEMIEYIQRQIK